MHDISIGRRTIRRTASWYAVVGLATVTLVACHGKSAAPGGATSAPTSGARSGSVTKTNSSAGGTVAVKDFAFRPQTLTVSVGSAVTWRFEDSAAHTVDIGNGKIMSKPLQNNATYTHTFGQAGTYSYICSIHQYMHGTIVVK